MELAICSLASGSAGNCYLVRSKNSVLLVDAGISARRIIQSLKSFDIFPEDITAVLVTHEHSDHTKGLKILSEKTGAPIYGTEKTLEKLAECGMAVAGGESIRREDNFKIGDIDVEAFAASHDAADPVGFILKKGKSIAIVTDTGVVTEGARRAMKTSDILVLESNHDENMLRVGRYPKFLKERILSDLGHLSNEAAAAALTGIFSEEREKGACKKRTVLLAHLSRENNLPGMALVTVQNILEANGFSAGKEFLIEALPAAGQSPVYGV